MPCPEYESLHIVWKAALLKDTKLSPSASTVRGMHASKLSDQRVNARRELLAIEDKRNSHIRDCAVCQREDRPILDSSEVHE